MGKQSEEYRLQMLRRLENRYGNDKPTEVLEAEEVIAKFRQEKARDRQAITRLSSPLPASPAPAAPAQAARPVSPKNLRRQMRNQH